MSTVPPESPTQSGAAEAHEVLGVSLQPAEAAQGTQAGQPAAPPALPAQPTGAPTAAADGWKHISPALREFESPEALARAYLDLRAEREYAARGEEGREEGRQGEEAPAIPRDPDGFLNAFARDPYATVGSMIEARAREIALEVAQEISATQIRSWGQANTAATKMWNEAVAANPEYAKHEEALAEVIMKNPTFFAQFPDPVSVAWSVLQGGRPAAAMREAGRAEGRADVLQTQVESARAPSSPGGPVRPRDDAAEILGTHGGTEPILRPA